MMDLNNKRNCIIDGFAAGAAFFQDRSLAMELLKQEMDWPEHTSREWELEYDYLFRGMAPDIRMPLWASVSMGERVLLNETTLEVIRYYHRFGYEPIRIEGNPPDYIGEQLRFLAYLSAILVHLEEKIQAEYPAGIYSEWKNPAGKEPVGKGPEGKYQLGDDLEEKEPAGKDADKDAAADSYAEIEEIRNAREDFLLYYTLDNLKSIRNTLEKETSFRGFITFVDRLLQFAADEEHQGTICLAGDGRSMIQEEGDLDAEKKLCGYSWEADTFLKETLKQGRKPAIADQDPYVVPTAGLNNCGGKCVIRPTMQEGCMLRIESDCSSNQPQIRACVRGRGYRKTFLSPDRLRYPMKRVGERGSGRFERISWEKAVELLAEQWIRIRDTYGPGSRYLNYGAGVTGIMRPSKLMGRLLSLDGGYLSYFNSYSSACLSYTMPYIYGTGAGGHGPQDILNTKLLILWGHNPAETIFGPERNYYFAELKKRGIRVIVIDPRLSQTAVAHADQWIPIRPATDSALADAMAYVIWSEGLQDQTFMDTYCIGFDEDHMPEGIPAGESYHTYLFGLRDGVKKTPEWAEQITGVPADTIRTLARDYAKAKPACIDVGLGPQRNANGEQTSKAIAMLCCLTGNVGISGGSCGGNGSGVKSNHEKPGLFTDQVKNPYPGLIPTFQWSRAVEHGTEMTPKKDRLKGVEKLDSNIKLIFSLAGNALVNQHSDIRDTIRILKDESLCEFIVSSDIFLTPSARYSDLILPAASVFEVSNITAPWTDSNYFLRNNQVMEPLFGCRFEWEWIKELSAKLGYYEVFTDGMETVEEWLKANYEILRTKEPELPDYETFCKLGGWQYKDQTPIIPFENEIRDPEQHPFQTPSGKIEIFSKTLYEMDEPDTIPAIPKYVPAPRGYDDPRREQFPLQLVGWHTRRRCHSVHDNNEWQEELEKTTVWIHPDDANKRGIKEEDLVEIFNDLGTVRIPAHLTTRIMPGVTAMSQGAWYQPDKDGVDIRGSINVLTAMEPTPLAKGNPQHTNLVEIRKVQT